MTLSVCTGTKPAVSLVHRPRVLIIDDEQNWHDTWEEELGQSCQISYALSGKEGVQMMHQIHPDLIILDRNMPGMSGDEVLVKIRSLDTSGRIKVVMHSVRDNVSEQVEKLSTGADIYLPKTTDMRIAAQTVKNLLATQRSIFTAAVVRTIRQSMSTDSFADRLIARGAMQFTSLLTETIPATPVDLYFIASQVVSVFEDQLQARGATLNISFEELSSCFVNGDDQMLATALFHIVDFVAYRIRAGMQMDFGITVGKESHSFTVRAPIQLSSREVETAFWWHLDDQVEGRELALALAWEIVAQHGGVLRLDQDESSVSFLLNLPARPVEIS